MARPKGLPGLEEYVQALRVADPRELTRLVNKATQELEDQLAADRIYVNKYGEEIRTPDNQARREAAKALIAVAHQLVGLSGQAVEKGQGPREVKIYLGGKQIAGRGGPKIAGSDAIDVTPRNGK